MGGNPGKGSRGRPAEPPPPPPPPRRGTGVLTRVKSAVAGLVGGLVAGGGSTGTGTGPPGSDTPLRFPYARPYFLGLSPDEVECSADHGARPILILKETRRLPWATGYAEVINAGKSALNEDQACCEVVVARRRPMSYCPTSTPSRTPSTQRRNSLPNGETLGLRPEYGRLGEDGEGLAFHYWALFDGHAGWGVAVAAARLLQHHIAGQLQPVMDVLRDRRSPPPAVMGEEPEGPAHLTGPAHLQGPAHLTGPAPPTSTQRYFTEKKIQHESLVVGAMENAFKEMDAQIEREKQAFSISGGCTALAVVSLLGKLYGYMQPYLLGNEFTHLEFPRRVQRKEVGKRMLYRDFTMSGWAYKTIEDDDLKFPLIYGEGKKARVLATIGVTRGLGDHDLKVHDSNIYIKPFLSCCPEVRVYDLWQYEHGADDVLVMGTDGLWDVLSSREVADAVAAFLSNCDPDDLHRYTMAAQDLVMRARGVLRDRGWRIGPERLGSGDDISVFIVPLMYGNRQL
ncbi:unnamed protein product [Menidia menidia]|uniref:(Atlantic silverside) hypothetical protein n=1 Tax=Menidia menidia TaxID=238744 RepID=A0A8S4B990_9TELE|nr:unnamed protein product [Menidia menidia]